MSKHAGKKKASKSGANESNSNLPQDYNILIALGIMIFCVVWSLRNINWASLDDLIEFYKSRTLTLGEYLSQSWNFMLVRSRPNILVLPFLALPYLLRNCDSQALYIIGFYIPIIFNVLYFAYLVKKYINKYVGYFVIALFFLFIQIDPWHNVMICFPIAFHISMLLFLISTDLFLRYQKELKTRYLLISSFLMLNAIFLYEAFLTYISIFFILSLIYNVDLEKKHVQIKNIINQLKYHVAAALMFLATFCILRLLKPLTYPGATIALDQFNLILAIKVIWRYSTNFFPFSPLLTPNIFQNFRFHDISLDMIVKGVLGMWAVGMILWKSEKIIFKKLISVLLISFVACFIFTVPYALTPLHQNWIKGGTKGFVPSFFSFYWIVLALSALAIYIINKSKKIKPIILLVLCPAIFAGSILTDYSNAITIDSKNNETIYYRLVDKLLTSSYYARLEDDAVIYFEKYNDILADSLKYLSEYSAEITNKGYYITNNYDEIADSQNKYCVRFDRDSKTIYFCKISEDYSGDEALIITAESYASGASLYFRTGESESFVSINGQEAGYFKDIAAVQINDFRDEILVNASNIDFNTLKLVKGKLIISEIID